MSQIQRRQRGGPRGMKGIAGLHQNCRQSHSNMYSVPWFSTVSSTLPSAPSLLISSHNRSSAPLLSLHTHPPNAPSSGTQHGSRLRLDNAGVASSNDGAVSYGHHYFTVTVKVPSEDDINPRARQILQRLALMRPGNRVQGRSPLGAPGMGGSTGGRTAPPPPPPRQTMQPPRAAPGAQPGQQQQQQQAGQQQPGQSMWRQRYSWQQSGGQSQANGRPAHM